MKSITTFGGFVLLAVASLTIMVGCVIVPGLTRISEGLGVAGLDSWLVTVPSLGVVVFGPLVAMLLPRIGLRNGLRLGLFLYGLLGAGAVLLQGAWLVLADRLLLGGATALIMASGTGLLSQFYSGSERLAMIARQGMAIELGGVLFLFVGGLLAVAAWGLPFVLYLFAWALWLCVELAIPPTARAAHGEGNVQGNERIPGTLWRVYVAATLSMMVFFCAVISLPRQLQGLGLSEAQVGYFLSGVSLVAVFAAALMPRASAWLGDMGTLVMAFICYGVAHTLFCLGDGLPLYLLGGIALGSGFGLSIPMVNHMTVEQSAEHQRGRTLAYLSMAIFLGQFLSSLLEVVPGSSSTALGAAALVSLAAAVLLQVWHLQVRGRLARRPS